MAESLHILLGTSACLQWLCHSGERTVARGPLVEKKRMFGDRRPVRNAHFSQSPIWYNFHLNEVIFTF